MTRITDRLLSLVSKKVTADAGCSTRYICDSSGAQLAYTCCLNEGCYGWYYTGASCW